MNDLILFLASESDRVPPDHVAANLALPIAILIFCGSVYLLLWSNYGAKKGALIYSVAFFGFNFMLGVFWWFGAPGTPVATGLQNFPGQATDAYQGAWYGMQPGSPRAEFFDSTNNFDEFVTPEEMVGTDDPEDPGLSFLKGDLEQANQIMLSQFLPRDEAGSLRVGANRRQEFQEAAGEPQSGEARAEPFFTAELATTEDGTPQLKVIEEDGIRIAGAQYNVIAQFVEQGTNEVVRTEVVETGNWFAFKDPGAIWFPSAVWTGVSLLLFVLSLVGLDRMEQREKEQQTEVQEPEDLASPIAQ
ncbi:MAG: hypothetical protein R3343_07655 [Nitriliruptorales bacterium]|nr:hypothetical protein [Nitriliruptorales bacterium]